MDELQKKYEVDDSFFHRYFVRNAENRFVNNLKRFMLWREGTFHNPKEKLRYVKAFLVEELEDFYEKGRFVLPQIGFSLTTRCTLRCRDCIALSPLFEDRRLGRTFTHIDVTADEFRRELTAIADSVDGIKRLFLHGGEPFLNKDLPEIIECSAKCEKIELVELITNATVVPQEEVLEVIAGHKDKIYLAVNNYSQNPDLRNRLRYEEIIALLKERGIKHPLYSELYWYRQEPLQDQGYTPEKTRHMFAGCWCKHSLQILDGILAICPRASIGMLLGLFDAPAEDIVNLRKCDTSGLRQELLAFYRKDVYAACAYCAPQMDVIPPALQAKN
ncbi:MAG: radical SAM protein [Desulfovibrio sp.]|jgi:organic radical activating enzyme|nr:radical SAM protein [Desulfovibrio sp.]